MPARDEDQDRFDLDAPPDDDLDELGDGLAELVRLATREVLNRDLNEFPVFLEWMVDQLPIFLPDFMLEQTASSPQALRSLAHGLGRALWNAVPRPDQDFRKFPLPEPAHDAPCPCGSGHNYGQCCAGIPLDMFALHHVSLLGTVLETLTPRDYPRIAFDKLDPMEMAFAAIDWKQQGRDDDALLLLDALWSSTEERSAGFVPAFDALMDFTTDPSRRARILGQALAGEDITLRFHALLRQATLLADRQQWPQAWQVFAAARQLLPDDPASSHTEVLLLSYEGREREAGECAARWADSLASRCEPDLDDLIEMLRAIAATPQYARQIVTGASGETNPPLPAQEDPMVAVPPAPPRATKARTRPASKKTAAADKPAGLLQLRIDLDRVEPVIWRRVVVRDSLDFFQLHRIIQEAMGWEDEHMHEFTVGDLHIGTDLDGGFGDMPDVIPEDEVTLAEAIGKKRKFKYWYDFGDDWHHTIAVEKRLPADAAAPCAALLDGERACPLEDCGGPWGYADLLAALADPKHESHSYYADWVGTKFDPNIFDLKGATKRVAKTVKGW
jgi:hypothetical protein